MWSSRITEVKLEGYSKNCCTLENIEAKVEINLLYWSEMLFHKLLIIFAVVGKCMLGGLCEGKDRTRIKFYRELIAQYDKQGTL